MMIGIVCVCRQHHYHPQPHISLRKLMESEALRRSLHGTFYCASFIRCMHDNRRPSDLRSSLGAAVRQRSSRMSRLKSSFCALFYRSFYFTFLAIRRNVFDAGPAWHCERETQSPDHSRSGAAVRKIPATGRKWEETPAVLDTEVVLGSRAQ